MTLSDKRKELRWQIAKRKEKKAMSLLLDAVELQDKEFIKELITRCMPCIEEMGTLKHIIRELAGPKLT